MQRIDKKACDLLCRCNFLGEEEITEEIEVTIAEVMAWSITKQKT